MIQIIPILDEQKLKYNDQIIAIKNDLKNSKILSNKLKVMLEEVKEKLTLQDFIKSQASKQVEFTFEEQINELLQKIENCNEQRSELLREIESYNDKQRAKEINDKFKKSLDYAQSELGIKDPVVGTILQYNQISKNETGSRAPRAVLAYHYALLKTIEDKSTMPMLPVVIDSPKQQDPDQHTIKKLFSLCIDGLSRKSQLIIGSVAFDGNIDNSKVLLMKDKYSLLKSYLYDDVYNIIMPLYRKGSRL